MMITPAQKPACQWASRTSPAISMAATAMEPSSSRGMAPLGALPERGRVFMAAFHRVLNSTSSQSEQREDCSGRLLQPWIAKR